MDEISINLLRKIFIASSSYSGGVEAIKFRAEHHEHLDTLDKLQENNYLDIRDGKYYLKLITLKELSASTQEVESLLYLCQHLFTKLRAYYLKNPGGLITVEELTKLGDLPRSKIIIGLSYMVEAPIFGGYSTDLKAKDAHVVPSESILKYKSFQDVIETIASWQKNSIGGPTPYNFIGASSPINRNSDSCYVDRSRIEELKQVRTVDFDLKKVVRICEELNSCLENSNFFAIASLVRTILDHIPPIFNLNTFKEVANNYGGRSLKRSFQNLENSSRKIADALLHQKIRKSESLPTKVMVDFSSDVDVLLAEIIRIINEKAMPNKANSTDA